MHGQYGSSEMASCSPPTDSNSGVRTAATATIAGDSTRLSCREFGGKVRMQIGKEENLAKTWRKRRMLTLLSFVKVLTLDPADPPHHESMIAFGKIMCCMKRPALEKSRAGGMGKIYLRAGSIHVERTKMEELLRKSEALEASSSQKDSQIGLLRPDRTSGPSSRSINLPGTSEIEQMNDKVHRPAVVTQIRGARKVNNDQVAIDVEMQKGKPLDDEDDDKAHGFKSLTMSHIVPKFTRPISDRIDGMWVSGDRLLMRQPTMRLGILIYWIALHALLASFI